MVPFCCHERILIARFQTVELLIDVLKHKFTLLPQLYRVVIVEGFLHDLENLPLDAFLFESRDLFLTNGRRRVRVVS